VPDISVDAMVEKFNLATSFQISLDMSMFAYHNKKNRMKKKGFFSYVIGQGLSLVFLCLM